ncbi:hypothetical protein ACOMHN_019725 [Nucella lapillus]
MSQAAVKGVIWTVVLTGIGYGLMQAFTPSESEIREKLREKEGSALRQRNQEFMAVLKRSAGIEDKDTKKK